jgi:hypothetical protein
VIRTPKKHISPDSKNEMKSLRSMGNQYLNSGESIILTTHSVSVDEGLYDVLLTNERIVLVDNRYTRFEPRTIPFTQIISVKGGKIPSGEPVITLVLTESGTLADSTDRHLIFTQQQGDERRHERDVWVKRLIELVIAARQHSDKKETSARELEPGVKPTVRRWVAPDHLLPRSAPEKNPAPAKVIVEPDETEQPEFLFEEPVPGGGLITEELQDLHPAGLPKVDEEYYEPVEDTPPAPPEPVPFPVLIRSYFLDEIRQQESEGSSNGSNHEGTVPAYTGEADETDDLLAAGGNDHKVTEPFSSTVSAAIASLTPQKHQEPAEKTGHRVTSVHAGVPAVPPIPVIEESVPVNVDLPPAAEPPAAKPAQEIPGTVHHTGASAETGPRPGREAVAPAPVRVPAEIPPALPRPVIVEEPSSRRAKLDRKAKAARQEPPLPPQEPVPAKRMFPGAALAVLAILLLVAGVVLVALIIPTSPVSHNESIVTPVITVPPTIAPVPESTFEAGIRVRVISSGPYAGTIGNPEYLHQVSGSGDRSYTVLKNDALVSATLQKQNNDGAPLTIEIYSNGVLLATRTVTAPQGEVTLLIDPKTASPPGITPVAPRPASASGNATLTYF